jgi:hypothetical protein
MFCESATDSCSECIEFFDLYQFSRQITWNMSTFINFQSEHVECVRFAVAKLGAGLLAPLLGLSSLIPQRPTPQICGVGCDVGDKIVVISV